MAHPRAAPERALPNRSSSRAYQSPSRYSLCSIPQHNIVVFTDGSKPKDSHTGAGYISYQAACLIARGFFPLGPGKGVFDAKTEAALVGFKATLTQATHLLSPPTQTGSSKSVFSKFEAVVNTWTDRPRLPHTRPGGVKGRWVPGHLQIPGNEAADQAAKAGATRPPSNQHDAFVRFLGMPCQSLRTKRFPEIVKHNCPHLIEGPWYHIFPSSPTGAPAPSLLSWAPHRSAHRAWVFRRISREVQP